MANFTEKAIRAALLSLLEEKPLNKITVRDISERCGINRNSFYYHYQDIPTLLHEIFVSEIDRIISDYPSIESLEDCVNVTIGFSLENRRAILHIYNSINRDMFEQYLWQVCEQSVKTYIRTAFPALSISDSDRSFISRYLSSEIFGLTLGWLQKGMKDDIKPFLSRIFELRKGFTERMVENCSSPGNSSSPP